MKFTTPGIPRSTSCLKIASKTGNHHPFIRLAYELLHERYRNTALYLSGDEIVMTHPPHQGLVQKRTIGIAVITVFSAITLGALGLQAQDAAPKVEETRRSSIVEAGCARLSNLDDQVDPTDPNQEKARLIPVGYVVPAGKEAPKQKPPLMGGTVYFAVFKNVGLGEGGDTFGTGLKDFDQRFSEGRSALDTSSPIYDRKAKYLYLYQVVNDRSLGPRHRHYSPAKKGDIKFAIDDNIKKEELNLPHAKDIATFTLRLLVDPRYITSWGHFRDAGFASNVVNTD